MDQNIPIQIGTLLSTGKKTTLAILAESAVPLLTAHIESSLSAKFTGLAINRQALNAILNALKRSDGHLINTKDTSTRCAGGQALQ